MSVLARLLWAGLAEPAPVQAEPTIERSVPAQSDAPPLSWRSPPGCPQRDDLVRAIEALLGAAMAAPADGALAIEGSIEPDGARWRLRLRIVTDSGERTRELPGATCQELLDLAAVLIAVAVDPRVADVGEAPEPDATEPVAPRPPRHRPPRPRARDRDAPRSVPRSHCTVRWCSVRCRASPVALAAWSRCGCRTRASSSKDLRVAELDPGRRSGS
ncbi:MAG: hypothetical protein U0168_07550 [Nannocystaceae bacterium]